MSQTNEHTVNNVFEVVGQIKDLVTTLSQKVTRLEVSVTKLEVSVTRLEVSNEEIKSILDEVKEKVIGLEETTGNMQKEVDYIKLNSPSTAHLRAFKQDVHDIINTKVTPCS